MKILVVGRGGREHSIVLHVAKSEQVQQVFAAPGNAGMKEEATCIDIDEMDIDQLVEFAQQEEIDLTIVGPENPLNAGIANQFKAAGLNIFAPLKEAALLEGSKSFAKEFMVKHDIPTAEYATFTDAEEAKKYIRKQGAPIVVKADGLAEGKGVIVAETEEVAFDAIDQMMVDKVFAEAGNTIVIEEFLDGREFSLMAFVHEDNFYPMLPARDYKRAYDHDEGLNTGGMGSFSPVPDITDDILAFTYEEVLEKAVHGLMKDGRPFSGILYAGLMMTEDGPKVIEFNTRFGDPETQVVLPLLKNDLVQVFLDTLSGKDPNVCWEEKACVGVVVASKGYPGSYETGVALPALAADKETFVIQAGVKNVDGHPVSNGGRVLLAGAVGEDFKQARSYVYDYLQVFSETDAFFYRTDIGKLNE